jgi:hypothetical protein
VAVDRLTDKQNRLGSSIRKKEAEWSLNTIHLFWEKTILKLTIKESVNRVYKMAPSSIFIKLVPIKFTSTQQRKNDGVSVKQADKMILFVNLRKRLLSW